MSAAVVAGESDEEGASGSAASAEKPSVASAMPQVNAARVLGFEIIGLFVSSGRHSDCAARRLRGAHSYKFTKLAGGQ